GPRDADTRLRARQNLPPNGDSRRPRRRAVLTAAGDAPHAVMMNPWPIAIRLVLGLAVTVASVLALNRYADREPELPPDMRIAVFNDVFEDVAAGEVRLKKWR